MTFNVDLCEQVQEVIFSRKTITLSNTFLLCTITVLVAQKLCKEHLELLYFL